MIHKQLIEAVLWPVYTPILSLLRSVNPPKNETDNSFQIFAALVWAAAIELGLCIGGIVLILHCFGN